jgi:hypothetical protein
LNLQNGDTGEILICRSPGAVDAGEENIFCFPEEQEWMFSQLSRLGVELLESPVRMISSLDKPIFSIKTKAGNILFKSVPRALCHEIKLLFFLQGRYPDFFPGILSINIEKNWILMKNRGRSSLLNTSDIKLWEEVIRTYSLIQLELTNHLNTLAYFDCPDRRPWMVKNQLFSFLDNLNDNYPDFFNGMLNQDKVDFLRIIDNIKILWLELMRFHIPESLEYGGLKPGSIYLDRNSFYFDNLSGSSISHPFFSMNFILDKALLTGVFPGSHGLYERFRDIYLEPWLFHEPRRKLVEAFEIAQKLSWMHLVLYYHFGILPLIQVENNSPVRIPEYLGRLKAGFTGETGITSASVTIDES